VANVKLACPRSVCANSNSRPAPLAHLDPQDHLVNQAKQVPPDSPETLDLQELHHSLARRSRWAARNVQPDRLEAKDPQAHPAPVELQANPEPPENHLELARQVLLDPRDHQDSLDNLEMLARPETLVSPESNLPPRPDRRDHQALLEPQASLADQVEQENPEARDRQDLWARPEPQDSPELLEVQASPERQVMWAEMPPIVRAPSASPFSLSERRWPRPKSCGEMKRNNAEEVKLKLPEILFERFFEKSIPMIKLFVGISLKHLYFKSK